VEGSCSIAPDRARRPAARQQPSVLGVELRARNDTLPEFKTLSGLGQLSSLAGRKRTCIATMHKSRRYPPHILTRHCHERSACSNEAHPLRQTRPACAMPSTAPGEHCRSGYFGKCSRLQRLLVLRTESVRYFAWLKPSGAYQFSVLGDLQRTGRTNHAN
jgi:hypothetical protein